MRRLSKIRVYQLAKDIGVSSKDLIAKLLEEGIEVANHMSALEDDEANLVMKIFGKSNDSAPKADAPLEAPKKEVVDQPKVAKAEVKAEAPKVEEDSKKNRKKGKKGKQNRREEVVEEVEELESGVVELLEKTTVGEFADKIGKQQMKLLLS